MHFFRKVGAAAVFILALVCSSAFAADNQQDLALQALMGNAKLLEATQLLAPFNEGQERVKIIVTIEPSAEAKGLAGESRKSSNDAQSMFVEGGPVFYDLSDDSIKTRLRETVPKTVGDFVSTLDSTSITVERTFSYIFGFSGSATVEGLQLLADNPAVKAIEEDRILEAHLNQGIPLMNGISARSTYDGSGLSIAICDTGIDTSHPRLGGGGSPIFNSKVIGGTDTGDSDGDPRPDSINGQAHGTACAGISAGDLGTTGDYIGGVAPGAKLYAVKISTGNTGSASSSAMIEGWEWPVTHQYDDPSNPIMIISTSFGGGRHYSTCDSYSPSMTTAAANAVAAGITVFASSGNDGYCDSMGWPACISYVNAVGAVYDANFGTYYPCVNSGSCATKYSTGGCSTGYYSIDSTSPDKVTSYSNSASFLTLFAPSNAAYTTDIVGSGGYNKSGDYDATFGGTSAACPYAAGAAAVLQSAAKSKNGYYLTPAQVKSLLVSNGDNITDGKVAITKPRINLGKAIAALGGSLPSSFSWPMVLPALTLKKSVNPSWGADNNVCCSAGPYTFAITSGGVTKRATNANCSTSATWEGYQSTTPGVKLFSWTSYGSCVSYYGSFYYTLNKNRRYLFYAKWTGSTIQIWVTIYRARSADPSNKTKEEQIEQKLVQEIALDESSGIQELGEKPQASE